MEDSPSILGAANLKDRGNPFMQMVLAVEKEFGKDEIQQTFNHVHEYLIEYSKQADIPQILSIAAAYLVSVQGMMYYFSLVEGGQNNDAESIDTTP